MSKTQAENSSSSKHNNLQKSFTLNRKYVSRPIISIEGPLRSVLQNADAPEPESTVAESEKPESEPLVPEEPLRSILQTPPSSSAIHQATKITISAPDEETGESDAAIAEAFSEPDSAANEDSPADEASTPDTPPEPHPYQKIIEQVSVSNNKSEGDIIPPPTPRELKNEAVKKALKKLDEQKEDTAVSKVIAEDEQPEEAPSLSKSFKKGKRHSSIGKFIVAFATSAVCVGVLGYFVSLNLPSISVRVAAMQTGIEASYPNYIPRDYQLSGVFAGDESTIDITFTSNDGDSSFHLQEEKSSWDSNALLNNYVKSNWDDDYTALREQGITIFIHNSDAAWVNGGILYKITTTSGTLTKKQIKNIALSL